MQSIRSTSIFYCYLLHVLVISVYPALYLLAEKFNEWDYSAVTVGPSFYHLRILIISKFLVINQLSNETISFYLYLESNLNLAFSLCLLIIYKPNKHGFFQQSQACG